MMDKEVNPKVEAQIKAGQIGIAQPKEATIPISMGKGAQAPAPVSHTTSNCGSQGKR